MTIPPPPLESEQEALRNDLYQPISKRNFVFDSCVQAVKQALAENGLPTDSVRLIFMDTEVLNLDLKPVRFAELKFEREDSKVLVETIAKVLRAFVCEMELYKTEIVSFH